MIDRIEIFTSNQRDKILKIADRHGWDTVKEYLDDPLADSVEDASTLRTAVTRTSRRRNQSKSYARGSDRGGFNAKSCFRGFGQRSGQQRNEHYNQERSQQSLLLL